MSLYKNDEKMTNKEMLKEMKRLYSFINELNKDIMGGMEVFLDNLSKSQDNSYWNSDNYCNKNFSKTSLKRKITTVRQELMNVSNLLDKYY